MNKLLSTLLFFIPILGISQTSIYDIKVKTIDNKEISLSKYKNRVMLIVNVASKCGFTYQYEGLEKLHEKYSSKGLSILGFPCNQFMNQEPGTNEDIKEFCSLTYQVKFDMFSKIDVNGDDTSPLYKYLKSSQSGLFGTGIIKWNFTKFLVDRNGKVIKRYSPSTNPSEIEDDIKELL
jgi:glutathione peroxidase|tara:strand:- start:10644 stop:11177 length:534 start_codon:yes stop_codon:yes gene_type:complete